MKNDTEAAMVSFYLVRGHSLESIMGLSTAEKAVYTAAMERYYEDINDILSEKQVS